MPNYPHEIPFIYELKSKSGHYLELQRQGVEFLNSLDNNRVILLFSVSTTVNAYPFSTVFATGTFMDSSP